MEKLLIGLCVKANLHWGVARSIRARFFVCFSAPRSCPAEPCTSAELPDATKQTKNRARLLLATRQCRLALTAIQRDWLRCVRLLTSRFHGCRNDSATRFGSVSTVLSHAKPRPVVSGELAFCVVFTGRVFLSLSSVANLKVCCFVRCRQRSVTCSSGVRRATGESFQMF